MLYLPLEYGAKKKKKKKQNPEAEEEKQYCCFKIAINSPLFHFKMSRAASTI